MENQNNQEEVVLSTETTERINAIEAQAKAAIEAEVNAFLESQDLHPASWELVDENRIIKLYW